MLFLLYFTIIVLLTSNTHTHTHTHTEEDNAFMLPQPFSKKQI